MFTTVVGDGSCILDLLTCPYENKPMADAMIRAKASPRQQTGGSGSGGSGGGGGDDHDPNSAFWLAKQQEFMVTIAHKLTPHSIFP